MHSEVLQWLDACRASLSICDLGSYQVNGSARDHFHGWNYVGVDCRPGPGVTVVADAREWDADGRQFDVVVSCEMLEHCPEWQRVISNAFRLTKPNGYFFGTAAGPKRPVHSSDGMLTLADGEHYANISPDELRHELTKTGFEKIVVRLASDGNDVQWSARKPK